MMKRLLIPTIAVIVFGNAAPVHAANPLIGDWALQLPSGGAGWLEIREGKTNLEAGLMWEVGSVRPVPTFKVQDGGFTFTRSARRPLAPKSEPPITGEVRGWLSGDQLKLISQQTGSGPTGFIGKRMPPRPERPDLGKVSFGEPITLFNGRNLTGWRPTDPAKKNGWSAQNGILRNDTPKTDFSAYGDHANLRTEAEFTNFQLHIEFRLPAGTGGNSGIYLCGRYEMQVTHRDSSMQGISGPGALFGRLQPTTNAGKPAGEWETYDITFVDRHVTVVHNGMKVIDNQPVAGPTGGALDADVTKPGPLMLQGDHTSVEYRNLVLRPFKP
jgi:hypothetical protein